MEAKYLKDYRPLAWRTDSVELDFDIREDGVVVTNRMVVTLKEPSCCEPLILDAHTLQLLGLKLDAVSMEITPEIFDGRALTLNDLPVSCVIEVVTQIDPWSNRALEGLYADGDMLITQNEAEGFRRITCFADRPDNMSVYTVTISADKSRYPVLLSNGNLLSENDLPDGRHRAVWHDPFPKPSYLFALVAGDLRCCRDTFITMRGRPIDLRVYVQPGYENRTAHALECLKKAMRWDEERFGLECDLDTYMIVATDSFNAGAMENKGLNIFNSACVLADPASATDADFESIDRIIAHEYFHNYTGNRITCRDWFQLTLKEGLTVYRDGEYASDAISGAVGRIEDVRHFRELQFAEDAGPLAHPIRPEKYTEINNFYTVTVYDKGAEVIRMIRMLVGYERFRQGFDTYFKRFDGQAVTTEDFLSAMREGCGDALDGFEPWYSRAGTPQVMVSDGFADGLYTLRITQSDERLTPFVFALFDRDSGTRISLERDILRLRETDETFEFRIDAKRKPIPSLLRDFSAPVKVSFDYADEELAFLLVHDDDPFARYEAGQTLMRRALLSVYRNGTEFPKFVADAWLRLLDGAMDDPRLAALMLSPPALADLCADLTEIDYPKMDAVRESFLDHLAVLGKVKIESLWRELESDEPYVFSQDAVAKRALSEMLLSLLVRADDLHLHTAKAMYDSVDNMTERMTAFRLLVKSENAYRQEVIDDFKTRWKNDPTVLDKWFAVQASSRIDNLVPSLRKLTLDPAFDPENPNRIRALLAAFVRNAAQYHHGTEGYAWIAEEVLRIDPFNPQLSARLAKMALADFQRLPDEQRNTLKTLYFPLLDNSGVSRDLHEILSLIFNR